MAWGWQPGVCTALFTDWARAGRQPGVEETRGAERHLCGGGVQAGEGQGASRLALDSHPQRVVGTYSSAARLFHRADDAATNQDGVWLSHHHGGGPQGIAVREGGPGAPEEVKTVVFHTHTHTHAHLGIWANTGSTATSSCTCPPRAVTHQPASGDVAVRLPSPAGAPSRGHPRGDAARGVQLPHHPVHRHRLAAQQPRPCGRPWAGRLHTAGRPSCRAVLRLGPGCGPHLCGPHRRGPGVAADPPGAVHRANKRGGAPLRPSPPPPWPRRTAS